MRLENINKKFLYVIKMVGIELENKFYVDLWEKFNKNLFINKK